MSWRGAVRRFLPYVIAIAGGFLLAYLVVAFVVFPAGVIPTDLKIPNVVGLSYDDAALRLQQAGFVAQRGEVRYHASAPKETVLEQSPPAGSKDVSGATVTLAVSNGQQLVAVPNVIGMSREQAENAIESAGFNVGEVTEQPNEQPRGQVIETRPKPGDQTPMPSPIALVLSSGPAVVLVPDVVGRNFAEARQLLEQVGLTVDATTDNGGAPSSGGTVFSMSPAAGAQVARGSRISLRVAGGGGATP